MSTLAAVVNDSSLGESMHECLIAAYVRHALILRLAGARHFLVNLIGYQTAR